LPYNQVIAKKLKPVLIKKSTTINETIECFENAQFSKAPNVILFQQGKEIFGGFANDSWSVSS